MSLFRRRRRPATGDLEGPLGLGDGEAPGGWDGPDQLDPFVPPAAGPPPAADQEAAGEAATAGGAGEPGRHTDADHLGEPEAPGPFGPGAGPIGLPDPEAITTGARAVGIRRRGPSASLVALPVIIALLVAGLVTDHLLGSSEVAQAAPVLPAAPSLAPAGALSSAWFCPALQATTTSAARGRVIVANSGASDLHVTASFTPSAGPPPSPTTRVIAAYARTTFRLEEVAPAPFTATTVTVDGIGGAVEQEVQGPLGESIAPCTRSSSDRWYFAAGRTDTDATLLLSLYNPFPADAIADLRFATDLGPTSPDAFQGIVVPGRGLAVVNVGERVRIRSAVATTVTVRSGRLVVDKLQIQSGDQPRGLSLTLGATAPGTTWYYPDGVTAKGRTEHFELYNPGSKEAQVDVTAILDKGSADPFQLTLEPGDRLSLQVDKEPRIPPDDGQAWVVSSTNGVPVVSERVMEAGTGSFRTGVADSMGSPVASERWEFPAGSSADNADEYLVVFNPGDHPARVEVTVSGLGQAVPLPGAHPLVIPPSSRRAVHINDVLAKGIVVIDVLSDVAVVAERAQSHQVGPGLSGTIGIAGG